MGFKTQNYLIKRNSTNLYYVEERKGYLNDLYKQS